MTNRRTVLKSMLGFGAVTAAGVSLPGIALADDLATIKKAGVLRIAMSGAYPPFNYVNDENKVVGFDPAIGEAIAARMGLKTQIITTAWDGIIGGLLADKYDAIVGSMSITPAREKVVDFVGPYYSTSRAIFTLPDSPLKTLADLKGSGVKVGATLGETHEAWARAQGYDVTTYKGLPELILALQNKRVNAIVCDLIAGKLALQKMGLKTNLLADLKTKDGGAVGIAIRKGNPELKAAMQKALDEIMAGSQYDDISKKWLGFDLR